MLEKWKVRLFEETIETAKRLNKLNKFMATETFYNLTRDTKDLLYEQQRTMSKLVEILGKRCEYYGLRLDNTEQQENGIW